MEIRPVILTTKQQKRLQDLSRLVYKYQKLLGLMDEEIEVGLSGKNSAFLHWHEERKVWGIYLLPSDNDFTPIHELGHIYLAKKTKYLNFAKSGIQEKKIFGDLLIILNHLLDCFVDYNLIQFNNLYELYIEDAHLWKHAKKKGKISGKPISVAHSYKTFIGHYLSLKLINKEKSKRFYIDVKNYLRKAKDSMKITYKQHKFNFQSLEKELDYFDIIKNTNDPKRIITFFCNILKEISLWKKNDLKNQLKLLFPNIEIQYHLSNIIIG